MQFRCNIKGNVVSGKIKSDGFYSGGVKPMRCVDLVAESKEARGPAPITEPYDVTKFLRDFKKNFNVD